MQRLCDMRIGFFDSGIGGLTILKAVRGLMPAYDYIFYGDTKNLPYGEKSEAEILRLTRDGVVKLFESGAAVVIVACNTASAETVRKLQDTLLTGAYADRKILGVIIPTVEVLNEHGGKHALLIGTPRTVHSGKYDLELRKLSPHLRLTAVATPELVMHIESGNVHDALLDASKTLDTHKGEIDTVVLGCTHYTVLKEELRKRFSELTIISQDELIPAKLEDYLSRHPEIKNQLSTQGTVEIMESGDVFADTPFKKNLLNSVRE
jgi:glutamate racemase